MKEGVDTITEIQQKHIAINSIFVMVIMFISGETVSKSRWFRSIVSFEAIACGGVSDCIIFVLLSFCPVLEYEAVSLIHSQVASVQLAIGFPSSMGCCPFICLYVRASINLIDSRGWILMKLGEIMELTTSIQQFQTPTKQLLGSGLNCAPVWYLLLDQDERWGNYACLRCV